MSDTDRTSPILTDADLRRGGLEPITAWHFTEAAERSAAARRKGAQRRRQRELGLRQFSRTVTAPTFDLLDAVARAAEALDHEGRDRPVGGRDRASTSIEHSDLIAALADPGLISAGRRVRALRGWRRSIARLLGLIER